VAIFVVAHGAWSAGWAWKKMRPLMRAAGHEFWTPTYTGVGERAHLANADIELDTHIQDVVGVLEYEDLRDVVLIGHSYGGMVARGVADRARERIRQLIYLDAFVPENGKSLLDYVGEHGKKMRQAAADGWRVPANPMPPDTAPADVAWASPNRMPQPIKTIATPMRLAGNYAPPRAYIFC
jgi:pimeloyl-ACP methyl ester carboxylesterase